MAWERWITVVLMSSIGVGVVAACGSPQSPPAAAASREPRAIAVRVVPASLGSISVSTAYAAVVEAKDEVNLVPLTAGRIERLNVDIGSEVRRGQVIAELSHGTLDVQLQQAEIALRNAKSKLAAVLGTSGSKETEPFTPLGVARARLNQLLNPIASDLQAAESAVSVAQAKLDSARTKLDKLLRPSATDLQVAESAVAAAQAKLDSAKTKLDKLLSPSAADLAAGQGAVAEAQSKFSTAQKVFNQAISENLSKGAMTGELRTSWQLVLDARISLQAGIATIENLQPGFGVAITPNYISQAQQIVKANQEVISSLLENINTLSLIPEDIRVAMWAESSAQAALETAKAKLRELQSPSPNAIALEQHNVSEAQASFDSARAKLRELQSPSPNTIALEQHSVSEAQAALTAAAAKLNALKNPDAAAVVAARAAVTAAEQEINNNQYLVAQAQTQIDQVKQQLTETQVLAPFDGVVTRRWLALGAMASPQTPVASLASKGVVVTVRIEETSISSLQRGQRVTFTSPALPGPHLDLQVDQIAPTGDAKAHTFFVQMHPIGVTPDLRPGMSGQVSIVTRRENVVLLPKEAVLVQGGQATLFVVQDSRAHLRKVEGGLVDDKHLEVLSGIRPGDQVVVSGQNLLKEGDVVVVEGAPERRRPPG